MPRSTSNLYKRGRAFLVESIAQYHSMAETGRIVGSINNPNKPVGKQRISQIVKLARRLRVYQELKFREEAQSRELI